MEKMEIMWLAACIIFFAVEAATPTLVSLWFGIGSLASLVVTALGGQLWLQIAVFIVVSGVTLVATRPLAKKYLDRKHEATNSDMVIGKTAVVTEEIDNLNAKGAVSCMGKEWSARTESRDIIPVGAEVTVLKIEGVKLIVKTAE